jgi:transposase
MSDHFDITLERKLESSADRTGDNRAGVRRLELITGCERRRRWSDDDKARIVVESLIPGANVSEVARCNGLSPQQLFAWRREARALFRDEDTARASAPTTAPQRLRAVDRMQGPVPGDEAPAFIPLVIAPTSPPAPSSPPSSPYPGTIEITIGDTVVRILGMVETATLVAVLRAVRRAS